MPGREGLAGLLKVARRWGECSRAAARAKPRGPRKRGWGGWDLLLFVTDDPTEGLRSAFEPVTAVSVGCAEPAAGRSARRTAADR